MPTSRPFPAPAERAPARFSALARAARATGAALALLALAACNRGAPGGDDGAAPDDATAEALRAVAVETGEALAGQEGAAAPTNALGAAERAPEVEPYAVTGAPSEPEAVRASEAGALDRPLFVWFVAADCEACAELESDVAAARDAWSDRVAFVTIDVDDPAAADVVRRLNVTEAPSYAVLYSSGAPAASFSEWPGAEAFGTYLEQVLQLDAGSAGARD